MDIDIELINSENKRFVHKKICINEALANDTNSVLFSSETHSIQDRCPDTFKCNDICDHGFSLRSVVGRECPVCECAKLVSGNDD